jgi:hypothetical protein
MVDIKAKLSDVEDKEVAGLWKAVILLSAAFEKIVVKLAEELASEAEDTNPPGRKAAEKKKHGTDLNLIRQPWEETVLHPPPPPPRRDR